MTQADFSVAKDGKRGLLSDEQLDTLELWLDRRFALPGTSFHIGLDGLVGLVPFVGDMAGAAFSCFLISEAVRRGARKRAIAKMASYVVVDSLLGTVPLVGDLFDFGFKSNAKILARLREEREHLARTRNSIDL
ncbi:DUF4112 domain-containing protein [Roseibium limicola]|uniref:DUF4112 domain-containing protein n=1 Tax=Roseibium limicola TaxID=2816037 RepID=A0A939EK68_9HYPH|nr:DUF4112 domain-containing protein [Roseibium limicola]MBO0344069.1 DUF4112 domain-containing protein [Roseibium limicola]